MNIVGQLIKHSTDDIMGVKIVDSRRLVQLTVEHCVDQLEQACKQHGDLIPRSDVMAVSLRICQDFDIKMSEKDTAN
jgi:hypothetical protein